MKTTCSKCHSIKSQSEFNKCCSNKNGKQRICKECSRLLYRQYYLKTYIRQRERVLNHSKMLRKELALYLKNKSCIKCGESNPIILELHHTKDKRCGISYMLTTTYSVKRLHQEIAKCIVMCTNCHRRHTSTETEWYSMKEKRCGRCQKDKPISAFGRSKNKYNLWCKLCHSEYNHDRYECHKEIQNDSRRQRRKIARLFVLEYLRQHPCVKCKEKDPIVLEFHHTNPTTKKELISSMVIKGKGTDTILKEIEKCQVLCANCHKKLTAKQQKWSK